MFRPLESRIMSATTKPGEIVEPSDEEIDAIIAEFGGDPKAAIRALLHDLTELALDSEAAWLCPWQPSPFQARSPDVNLSNRDRRHACHA
jgi:hypothetical protein